MHRFFLFLICVHTGKERANLIRMSIEILCLLLRSEIVEFVCRRNEWFSIGIIVFICVSANVFRLYHFQCYTCIDIAISQFVVETPFPPSKWKALNKTFAHSMHIENYSSNKFYFICCCSNKMSGFSETAKTPIKFPMQFKCLILK